ncbi:hypothetical protein AOLI_G00101670 [Acnodon oligacanthus]
MRGTSRVWVRTKPAMIRLPYRGVSGFTSGFDATSRGEVWRRLLFVALTELDRCYLRRHCKLRTYDNVQ